MIVPDELASWYRFHEPYLTNLRGVVRSTLATYCEVQNYAFVVRVKKLPSLAEKVESARFRSILEMDDLVAAAIIVPDLTHVEPTVLKLRALFDVRVVKGRGSTRKSPDAFRFESTRVVSTLRNFEGDGRPESLRRMLFEVQVRTAFEHAWSVTTHEFSYKSAVVDWKRLRLAAQLKALVEQADLMVLGFDRTLELVPESPWPEITEKLAIAKIFQNELVLAAIPEEVVPKDWSRFIDNLHGLLKANRVVRDQVRLDRALGMMAEHLSRGFERSFPRSLSLFQLCYGILRTAAVISPIDAYPILVTTTMQAIFPATRKDRTGFVIPPMGESDPSVGLGPGVEPSAVPGPGERVVVEQEAESLGFGDNAGVRRGPSR